MLVELVVMDGTNQVCPKSCDRSMSCIRWQKRYMAVQKGSCAQPLLRVVGPLLRVVAPELMALAFSLTTFASAP